MKFCKECGSTVTLRVPDHDDRHRHVCDSCATIHYENPQIVVVALPRFEDKVLMCKRAIEPRSGLWTLPGGFMENDETTQQAAARETWEEAGARITINQLYTLYNLPHINQVHIFYLAQMHKPEFTSGVESLKTELMTEAEIPWDQIAFPAVKDTLEHYFNELKNDSFTLRVADVTLNEHNQRLIKTHN